MRHGIDDPNRNTPHGVFNNDAISQTEDAWRRASDLKIEPAVQGNRWVYDIPSPEAGWQGGNSSLPGHGSSLNAIRIVTEKNSSKVITAFPVK